MRLIDADALKAAFGDADADVCESYRDGYCDWGFGRKNVNDIIAGIPTVDAVPVVRCLECTHYNGHRHCDYFYQAVLDDDFCSYGERRLENGK